MKYKSRDDKLKNAISDELKRKRPNLDNLFEVFKRYEKINLLTIDKLLKRKKVYTSKINGALKQTINSHGPITKNLLGSATKRVYGSLIELQKENNNKIKIKYYIFGLFTCIIGIIMVYLLK